MSLYYSIKVLNIEAYQGYKISNITKQNLRNKNSLFTKAQLTMDYKEVVMSYRSNNALKAKYLNKSILYIGILIVSMFIKQSI